LACTLIVGLSNPGRRPPLWYHPRRPTPQRPAHPRRRAPPWPYPRRSPPQRPAGPHRRPPRPHPCSLLDPPSAATKQMVTVAHGFGRSIGTDRPASSSSSSSGNNSDPSSTGRCHRPPRGRRLARVGRQQGERMTRQGRLACTMSGHSACRRRRPHAALGI
jgi:hypothetical protein